VAVKSSMRCRSASRSWRLAGRRCSIPAAACQGAARRGGLLHDGRRGNDLVCRGDTGELRRRTSSNPSPAR
jgi:hypothetical protein